MPIYEAQLMDEYFAGVSGTLFGVSLMASHLICGQTNYYIICNCVTTSC